MSIIYKIFEDYCERNFRVKPDINESNRLYKKMNKFKDSLALSEEQSREFEDFYFELTCDCHQSAFFDGFKVACDLFFEIAE